MATVSKWTPFGVALDITATGGTVTRTSATQFTVKINASWEVYYSGAATKYGMTASSGGSSVTLKTFSNTAASSGSGSFTGTYSISGNGSATKTITVTFRNFNNDNGDSATKNVTFNVTVPAWTSYTISYNANGGSGAPSSQTKWKDQTLTLSSTKPTRTGHSFLGWSTSSSATSATYSAGGSYTANSAATLYAVWKANTYTIAYNANGGTGAPSNQTKTYGKTLTLSSTKPTRTNYNFKGWGTSASATTVSYAAGGSYTANSAATLYAIWELAYTKPRIMNLSVVRCDSDGTINDAGVRALVSFDWECDYVPTSIFIQWRISSEDGWIVTSPSISGTSGSVRQVVASDGLDVESSYEFQIKITDQGGTSTVTSILPSMKFVIDLLAGGNGAAIGKVAEEPDIFDVGFKTRFFGGLSYMVLPADTDLNALLTPNFYVGQNANTYNYGHCPITSGTFTLEVLSAGPSGQIYQRLTVCDKSISSVYERFYYTSAWGEWYGGWVYPTLGEDFAMYGTSTSDNQTRYRKDGRLVEIRGVITPINDIAGSTSTNVIFTLPNGYRPSSPIYVVCQGSGNCTWLLGIKANGEVGFSRYRNGDTTTTASAGAWLPFQATFFNK